MNGLSVKLPGKENLPSERAHFRPWPPGRKSDHDVLLSDRAFNDKSQFEQNGAPDSF